MVIHTQKIYSCLVEYKSTKNIFIFTLCTLSVKQIKMCATDQNQSMTIATMEEMGVQNNDEGPMNRRNPTVPTTLQWRMSW